MKKQKKEKFYKAVISFFIFAILVIAIGSYFTLNKSLTGFVFLGLGIISLIIFKLFKIKIKALYPDMVFGMIDNGILVSAVVLGSSFAGITGAIAGGAIGNTITDGLGGLIEGKIAQNQRKQNVNNLRNPLFTMLGKMSGCLFGAGIGLTLVWLISLI